MSNLKFVKVVMNTIKETPGFSVDRTVEGKHIKLYLTTPSGPQMMVISRSASDIRVFENIKQLLRKWK